MKGFSYTNNIRMLIRCIPPADDYKQAAAYKKILKIVLNCDVSTISKEIKKLSEWSVHNYDMSPLAYYKQHPISNYVHMLEDCGINDDGIAQVSPPVHH